MTLGFATYVHDPSHKYRKLGPRGKKYNFIRFLEHSKGYVFIEKMANGSWTEIESRDVIFLEIDFPCKGEINKDFQSFEMEDPDIGGSPIQ